MDRRLPEEWEFYVHPPLNGLRPDLVLLNPRAGIAVFEVFDANYYDRHGYADPISRLRLIGNEIYNLYCPRLAARTGIAAITRGLVASGPEASSLSKQYAERYGDRRPAARHYMPFISAENLNSLPIATVFPEGRRRDSRLMSDEIANDLRSWLVEPEYSVESRTSIQLTGQQESIVVRGLESDSQVSAPARVKGPAGSGKSEVVAARAAALRSRGYNVLIISYNITLRTYLRRLVSNWPVLGSDDTGSVSFLNFHEWCKRVCYSAGKEREREYIKLWRKYFAGSEAEDQYIDTDRDDPRLKKLLEEELPDLVLDILTSDDSRPRLLEDVILVDEGQDFCPRWWLVLREACKHDRLMLFTYDPTQDLYARSSQWTPEAWEGAGFRGAPRDLKGSYRIPAGIREIARDYAEKFLPVDSIDLVESPQVSLFDQAYASSVRWIQAQEYEATDACVRAILSTPDWADPDTVSMADVTFLSSSKTIGAEVVSQLSKLRVAVEDTFADSSAQERRKKVAFFDSYDSLACTKATTIHSFKGWEARVLVVYLGPGFDERARALFYVALTRVKIHPRGSYLTIVSSVPELAGYGRSWPEYSEFAEWDNPF
jgi:hypothetical protein